ncbi:MAG: hypothetical protein K2H23_06385 [Oscillospiraceae bacterium]|nr:hypothetical protein [Oscillospiraceae bacterium]
MRFIRTDIKRIFTEPAFFLSIFLGGLLLFGAMGYLIISDSTDNLYVRAQALALPFAAPLLAAMPYSVMIMRERETLYSTLITVKLRKAGYRLPRLLTSGVSGAAALVIPQLALFLVCVFLNGVPDVGAGIAGLVLPITFGFGYAAFSYGLTFVNRQRYVPLVMPQVLYMLCIYAFPHIKLERFYPPLDISPSIYGGAVTLDRFILPLALTAAAVVLTLWGILKSKVGEQT